MQGRAVRDRGAWGGMALVLPLPLCSLSPWAQNTLSDPTRPSRRDPPLMGSAHPASISCFANHQSLLAGTPSQSQGWGVPDQAANPASSRQ